jgi:hypothetical protein
MTTSSVVRVATKRTICVGLAYSTQRVDCEDRHQFVKGGGVVNEGHHIPIAIE